MSQAAHPANTRLFSFMRFLSGLPKTILSTICQLPE
jgi:hypothetical protein